LRSDDDLGFFDRYPPPEQPWTEKYGVAHVTFVSDMLDNADIVARFATGRRLPRDYGVGLDERVVEYPWLFSQQPFVGRVLDAGSTLNHGHVLDRILPTVQALHIVTFAPESAAFTERGVSYVYADLRALPYRDGWFDVVVSLSTLEHVGMDNSRYGGPAPLSEEPRVELSRAVEELRRVLRPGGRIFVTVPFGCREDHGWLRQFDCGDVAELMRLLGPATTVSIYGYTASGWQSTSQRAAANAQYQEAELAAAADRAAAARAVACIALARR
jgi:SAM-dependent methyltransferase